MFLRIWEEVDVEAIRSRLFVIGELSGECFACHRVGLSLDTDVCPACKTRFEWIAFRRKLDYHSLCRFKDKFPGAKFIEYEDFKKARGKEEARKLFGA